MKLIKISEVEIPPRQRAAHAPSHIKDLKASILSKGLLHPIVLTSAYALVAGFGRLTAISEIHIDGHIASCDNQPIPSGSIPYINVGDLSSADLAEAELEENLLRANLTWEEQNAARVLILRLRQGQDKLITVAEVAREVAKKSGKSPEAEGMILHRALEIEKYKDHPKIKAAKTSHEAWKAAMDITATGFRATLAKLNLGKSEHQVINGDCREELKKIEAGSIDTILCDPPYGIQADKFKRTAEHFYDDTPEYGLEISKFIIQEGFKLLKPRGLLWLFCDIDHFITLREYAKDQAFTPWRTPILWRKGDEGQTPWGKLGFSRTYESILLLSKGQKGLRVLSPDIKDYKRPARSDRTHAAEKPVELLTHLLALSGDHGDVVLDPCAGSGSILEAASIMKMTAIAIEVDQEYYNLALARTVKSSEQPTPVPTNELLQ